MCSVKFRDEDVVPRVYVRFEKKIMVTLLSLFSKGKHVCFKRLENGERLGIRVFVTVHSQVLGPFSVSLWGCSCSRKRESSQLPASSWPQSSASAYLVLWGP